MPNRPLSQPLSRPLSRPLREQSSRPLSLLAPLFAGLVLLTACAERGEDGASDSARETPEAPSGLPRTASPEGARVFFISPADGDTVSSPVQLEFGIEGMRVVPAGVNEPDSGHHHLIVNAGLPDMTRPIPMNAQYIHYGDGSTSAELTLKPGEHSLQLLLGDYLHIPHDPPVASEVIRITVE